MKNSLLSVFIGLCVTSSFAWAGKTDSKTVRLDPSAPESSFTLSAEKFETREKPEIEWIKQTCYQEKCLADNMDGTPNCYTYSYDCSHYGHRTYEVKVQDIRVDGKVVLKDIPAGLRLNKKLWVTLDPSAEKPVWDRANWGNSDAFVFLDRQQTERTEGTQRIISVNYVFTAVAADALFQAYKDVKILGVDKGIAQVSLRQFNQPRTLSVSLERSGQAIGSGNFAAPAAPADSSGDRATYRIDLRDVASDWDRLPADKFTLRVYTNAVSPANVWNDSDFYYELQKDFKTSLKFKKEN